MKNYKYAVAVLAALALCTAALSSCTAEEETIQSAETVHQSETSPEDTAAPETEDTAVQETEAAPETEDTAAPETENTAQSEESVVELVLLDESGIKITAKSLDKTGWLGPELKLLIENSTDKNLTVQINNVSINGYMVDASMSEDVAAGKKANGEITFFASSLNSCGIDTIADMEFSFHIFDEGWETYLDSEQISVHTSAADTYTYTYDDSGEEIYNADGIRVICKGLGDGNIFGRGPVLMIHNDTDRTITVTDRDCSVNGFMLDPNLYAELLPGKYAVDDMNFWESDLSENEITEITDVEFALHIADSDNWMSTVDSDTITLHFD